MKQIVLAGLPWEVHSPSLLVHPHPEGIISIGFNGAAWKLGINNQYRKQDWPTRDSVAQAVAEAVAIATRENLA